MANTDKDFIVAIELGSSRISGIAGKKKDGAMHILAYAEEKTAGCIKRGVVYNIEKTYQIINSKNSHHHNESSPFPSHHNSNKSHNQRNESPVSRYIHEN